MAATETSVTSDSTSGVSTSGKCDYTEGESSESDGETEPAKSFHRRISTNKEIKGTVSNLSIFHSLIQLIVFFYVWLKLIFSCIKVPEEI